jgi:hypothetical protein
VYWQRKQNKYPDLVTSLTYKVGLSTRCTELFAAQKLTHDIPGSPGLQNTFQQLNQALFQVLEHSEALMHTFSWCTSNVTTAGAQELMSYAIAILTPVSINQSINQCIYFR